VSQDVEITVIGNEIPSEDTEDQTIVVKVTAQSLKDAFAVTPAPNWSLSDLTSPTDERQAYPAVTFTPSVLLDSASNDLNSTVIQRFEAHASTGNKDDSDNGGANFSSLQDYIANMDNAGFTNPLLNRIPVEAVRSVNNVDLVIQNGKTIAELFEVEADEAITTDTQPPADAYALRLFAQAVGAGKVSAGTSQAVQFDFVVGDSISLFVDYTLTKTRRYLLDDNTEARRFTIGGVTLVTSGTSPAPNNVETSTPVSKRVEFKFYAVAPAATP
jgi:hypothetical protein